MSLVPKSSGFQLVTHQAMRADMLMGRDVVLASYPGAHNRA
jgi:hypothetical protein